MRVIGVDEAGKGPVIGPMCIAGAVVDEGAAAQFKSLAVDDSKKLSPKKREVLFEKLEDICTAYHVMVVSAQEIDELRKRMTMNEIMVECFANVLNELNADRDDVCYLDAADVKAERFSINVSSRLDGHPLLISEHKADAKYAIVSAASIFAKVRRDEEVRKLRESIGVDFGSGYPSDPKTVKFLNEYAAEHGNLPDFVRHSWKTTENVLKKQVSLDSFS